MLSIGKLANGQEAYYLGKVAQGIEDYYAGDGEATGRWTGSGARELGLEGDVTAEELRLMLAGLNPADGEPLRDRPGNSGTGFDLTFSAPKSVSLVWAFGDDATRSKVIEAHEGALDAALGYLEDHAVMARRGKGGHQFLKAPNLLAAAYRHRLSRAGDPQIHTHVLISQLVKAPEDGRWTSLYSPGLFAHAKTAGFLYQAELRDRLARSLGLQWSEVARGTAEIEGIGEPARAVFSRRRGEIEAAQAEVGTGTAKSIQATVLATRKAKPEQASGRELENDWTLRGRQVGLNRETIRGPVGLGRETEVPSIEPAALAGQLTESRSHFTRKDVIQAVCEHQPDGGQIAQIEELADRFLESRHAVLIGQPGWAATYTTPEILRLEQAFLQATERGADAGTAVVPDGRVELVLAKRGLDEQAEAAEPSGEMQQVIAQQRQMVRSLTEGGHRIAAVSGVAGAGKTWALAAANEAWQAEGVPVIGTCASWRAADVLAAESGIPAQSIASLLGDCRYAQENGRKALPDRVVLVVDEAAIASTRDLDELRRYIQQVNGKLVMIGDYDQLQAVGAGGMFRAAYERYGVAELPYSRRQVRPEDRRVIELIADGHSDQALDILHQQGQVTVTKTAPERDQALVADWWQAAQQGTDAVIIARTNRQARELNQLAREVIQAAGQLGTEEIEAHDHHFAAGDLVVTRVNDKRVGVRNLQRWQVVAVDQSNLELRLRRVGDEHEAIVGARYLSCTNRHGQPALQHGYAITGHVAQGSTHEQVFVQADTGIDRQWVRTALSRAKEQMRLYAVVGAEPVIAETGPTAAKTSWQDLTQSAAADRAETAAIDEQLQAATKRKDLHELTRRWRVLDRAAAGHPEPESPELDGPDSPVDPDHAPPIFMPTHRAELALIERELANRRRAVVTANRLDPPAHIQQAIGEPPTEPLKAAVWTKASDVIERHRQIWGIQNPDKPLGDTPANDGRKIDRARTETQIDQLKAQINPATRETQTGADHPLTPFEERWTLDQQLTSRNDHGIEIEI